MRKNYFTKLVSYMKNVYHIDQRINKLKDGRVNPKSTSHSSTASGIVDQDQEHE
jgi:hypothetical protein